MVIITHASKDENGGIKNGKAGDQTGKEVCKREWYNRPWNVVIRFKSVHTANKVADCMEWAAENNNIGYDQNGRNGILNESRKYNYNLSKIDKPTECDCSSLIAVACMYAGVAESALTYKGNCATTSTLKNCLKQTGLVDVYTSPLYTASTEKLRRGDILLSEGHHTGCVTRVDGVQKKSIHDVALDCINGKYGIGAERRAKLLSEGYDPDRVQAEINSILKERNNKTTEEIIWDFLIQRIGNRCGVAGLMGNIKAESGFKPKNLQNSCEKRLGMNDDTYTAAVDSGAYTNFASDSCGYGLCQWTSQGRKQALLNARRGRSIGDIYVQLEFLWEELNTSYKGVLNALKTAKTIQNASDIVLTKFERPKDQSDKAKAYRANLGTEIFHRFSNGG